MLGHYLVEHCLLRLMALVSMPRTVPRAEDDRRVRYPSRVRGAGGGAAQGYGDRSERYAESTTSKFAAFLMATGVANCVGSPGRAAQSWVNNHHPELPDRVERRERVHAQAKPDGMSRADLPRCASKEPRYLSARPLPTICPTALDWRRPTGTDGEPLDSRRTAAGGAQLGLASGQSSGTARGPWQAPRCCVRTQLGTLPASQWLLSIAARSRRRQFELLYAVVQVLVSLANGCPQDGPARE